MTKDQGPVPLEEFELRTNALFEQVAQEIAKAPIEWDILAKKVQKHPHYAKRRLSISSIRSIFSELHYQHALYDIAARIPEVDPQPVFDDVSNNGLRFTYNKLQQLFVYDEATDESLCELDAVATINHLPVVFEVKLSRKVKSDQYADAVSNSRIQTIGRAVHAYFGTHVFGYALVTYPEIAAASAKLWTFQHHRGKIIPFPYSEEKYTREIARICHAYQIPIMHERRIVGSKTKCTT